MDEDSSIDPEGIPEEDISSPIEKILKNEVNPFTDIIKANMVIRFKNEIANISKSPFFVTNTINRKQKESRIIELHTSLKTIRYSLFDRINEIIKTTARSIKREYTRENSLIFLNICVLIE